MKHAGIVVMICLMLTSGGASWAGHWLDYGLPAPDALSQLGDGMRGYGCNRQGHTWNDYAHVCVKDPPPPEPKRWRCEPLQQGRPQFGYACQEVR